MRKFFPRLFITLCAILGILLIVPWQDIYLFITSINGSGNALLAFFAKAFNRLEWFKIAIIPSFILIVSLVSLIVEPIDFKKHGGSASKPIKNAIYTPLWGLGGICCVCGLMATYFNGTGFVITNYDFFGLGTLVNNFLPQINVWLSSLSGTMFFLVPTIFYVVLGLIIFFLGVFATKNMNKHGFWGNFFLWLLFILLDVIAYKGLKDTFINGAAIDAVQFFNYSNRSYLSTFVTATYQPGIKLYFAIGIPALLFILFVVIGIIQMHKNNLYMAEEPAYVKPAKPAKEKKEKKAKKEEEKAAETFEPAPQEEKAAETQTIDEGLFVLPKPEEVVETEVEEKTVIKQVVFEKADLNDIFGTDFGFKNCSMVKKDGQTDYFVSKQKFLTISNNGKMISFRLELDKAIRLIIQYPLIGKDKYENHKIWFKIDDISILNKDTVIDIIKDAYNTVLNNL